MRAQLDALKQLIDSIPAGPLDPIGPDGLDGPQGNTGDTGPVGPGAIGQAAGGLGQRVFRHVGQLAEQPESGSRPTEMRGSRYRQIVEAPYRVFYGYDGSRLFVIHVRRGEMRLRKTRLIKRDRDRRSA